MSHECIRRRLFPTRTPLYDRIVSRKVGELRDGNRRTIKVSGFLAAWGTWTLVSPEQFVDEQGNVSFDMASGFIENELGILGDRLIGTKPPLRLRLEAVPDTISPVASDGMVNFTTGEVRIFSGREELLDPIEQEIAWAFMLYGGWIVSEPMPVLEEGRTNCSRISMGP